MIHRALDGRMKGVPRIRFAYVDVRDVTDLHLRAMELPAANGERFLATTAGVLSMLDIAYIFVSG